MTIVVLHCNSQWLAVVRVKEVRVTLRVAGPGTSIRRMSFDVLGELGAAAEKIATEDPADEPASSASAYRHFCLPKGIWPSTLYAWLLSRWCTGRGMARGAGRC